MNFLSKLQSISLLKRRSSAEEASQNAETVLYNQAFPISLGAWDAPANSVMQAVINVPGIPERQRVLLQGIDQNGAVRVRRWLTSERELFKTAFISSHVDEKFDFQLTCKTGLEHLKQVSFTFQKLHEAPSNGTTLAFDENTVTVSMATYPARAKTLQDAVESLVDQTDNLLIYLNNYREVPQFLSTHRASHKIHYILDTASKLRAAAKFTWCDRPGYHVIVDDDIIYPSNYIETLKKSIEKYKRAAVVGIHGANFFKEIPGSGNHREEVFRFQDGLDGDRPVHLLGTGTIAFHASTMANWDWTLLREKPISNDEAFAVNAKRLKIPLVALAREPLWLKSHPEMQFGIFEEKSLTPGVNATVLDFLRENQPWPSPEMPGEPSSDMPSEAAAHV